MSLSQRLSEFNFDLETVRMLSQLGRNTSELSSELSALGFNQQLVDFVLNHERLFTRVMLRLRVYSEQNSTEQVVRGGFTSLSSQLVNNFLDYLFESDVSTSTQVVTAPVVTAPVVAAPVVAAPVVTAPVVQETLTTEDVERVDEGEISDDDEEDITTRFNNFFQECVSQTGEATDILKVSDAHRALTSWWNDAKYNDEVPDKKDLKTFLTDRLGKSHKSTWTNVCLA